MGRLLCRAFPLVPETDRSTLLFTELDCLKNLTELHLDANSIIDLSPIFQLSNITSLSAAGNGISHLDVSTSRWPQLQSLDLSRNKLAVVAGLDRLSSLTTLNLGTSGFLFFELIEAETD